MTKPIIICGSGASVPFLNSRHYNNRFWGGIEPKLKFIIEKNHSFGINYWYRYGCQTTANVNCDYQFYLDNRSHMQKLPLVVCAKDNQLDKQLENGTYNNTLELPHSGTYNGKDSWKKGFYSRYMTSLFCLSLSIELGFSEIYLLGIDCKETNGQTHFYEGVIDKKIMSKCSPKNKMFRGIGRDENGDYLADPFKQIERVNNHWFAPFKNVKPKIYNVSPNSAVDVFEKINYDEFYKRFENEHISQIDAREKIRSIIKEKMS